MFIFVCGLVGRKMGIGPSQEIQTTVAGNVNNAFLVERTVASMCDFLGGEGTIRLGVSGRKHMEDVRNPLAFQGIRIGDSPILSMKSCIAAPESVQYAFEADTNLHIFRRGEDVLYHL